AKPRGATAYQPPGHFTVPEGVGARRSSVPMRAMPKTSAFGSGRARILASLPVTPRKRSASGRGSLSGEVGSLLEESSSRGPLLGVSASPSKLREATRAAGVGGGSSATRGGSSGETGRAGAGSSSTERTADSQGP